MNVGILTIKENLVVLLVYYNISEKLTQTQWLFQITK